MALAQGCGGQADGQSDGDGQPMPEPPWIRRDFSAGGCECGTGGFPAGISSWDVRGRWGSRGERRSASTQHLSPLLFEPPVFISPRKTELFAERISQGFFHPEMSQV